MRKKGPRKPILYVHVGKAGGTTFNRVLQHHYRGEVHCERYIELRDVGGVAKRLIGRTKRLERLDFISGHLPCSVLTQSGFDLDDYTAVTLLRDPAAQTLSHLNWIIKISEDTRAPVFRNSSPAVREMSLNLRAADGRSPTEVAHWLEVYAGWFRNHQLRYFADPGNLDAAIATLDRFDLVGVTERIDAFIARFVAGEGLVGADAAPPAARRENVNPSYRVPRELLGDEGFARFLSEYNDLDTALYRYVERELAP